MTTTMTANPPLLHTTIGKKVAMSVSGLILYLWLIAHMLGNLKIWISPGDENSYAHWLRTMLNPPFPDTWVLYIIRVVAGVALIVHVYYAVVLSVRSKRARRTRYVHSDHVQANVASLTMRWGGLTIAAFLVFHLLTFDWGLIHPGFKYVRGHVSQNVIGVFGVWWMDVIYTVALAALGLHLYHSTWSMFQTWGVNSRRWNRTIRYGASFMSVFMFLGFMSVPFGVLGGAITYH